MQNREEIDIVDDRNEESDNSDNKDSDGEDIITPHQSTKYHKGWIGEILQH